MVPALPASALSEKEKPMKAFTPLIRLANRVGSSAAFQGTRRWCDKFPAELVSLPAALKVVSFTFDDFPATAVQNGAPILETYGGRGTYYACLSMCRETGSPNPHGDTYCPPDLERIAEGGHELACHTFDHASLLTASNQQIIDTIEHNAQQLRRWTARSFSPQFAFPYGLFRPNSRQLLSRYFRSLRTIHPGVHHGSVDLLALRASPLLRDTSIDEMTRQIRDVAAHGGWLTFYTHEVCSTPSPYGTTPEGLERLVSLCRDLGVEMLPVGDVVDRIAPRSFASTSVPEPTVPDAAVLDTRR